MITVLIALFAGAALYETTTMVDADSYMFPRMVTITLIVLACMQIVTEVRSRNDTAPTRVAPTHRSSFRRVGFVMALLTTVALIPVFGFLIASLLAYITIMMLTRHTAQAHEPTRMHYMIIGLVIVVALYWLFASAFQVPFPRGQLF